MATSSRRRLLVIDDDKRLVDLFTDYFADRYEVETAANGVEGLVAIMKRRPDIVLLDISMPGPSGLEVLRDIKRLDDRIPVIMVTASNQINDAEEALKRGAFAFLPKPFQLQYADHLVAAALTEARKG